MPTPPIERWRIDEMVAMARPSLDAGRRPCVAEIAARLRAAGRPADANTIRKYLRAEGAWEPAPVDIRAVAAPPTPGAPNPGMGGGEAVAGRIGGPAAIPEPEPIEPEAPGRKVREAGDTATVEFTSDELIRTDEDVVRAAGYDPAIWAVAEKTYKTWTTTLKRREPGRPDAVVQKQNYGWTVKLRRVVSRAQELAFEALYARMERHAPRYERPVYRKQAGGHSLLLGTTDLHFGKLCWGRETGEDYDLRIAEARLRDAADDLLSMAAGFPLEEVVLIIGSDLVHVDSQANTTTSGTPQDTDSRLGKIIETVEAAFIWLVERCAAVAPVRAYWIEGNHDRQTSFHIARTLRAWFRNHPGVTVDCSPTPRKYHRYGVNLLGLTHGDREKRSELPIIMATERKADWSETTTREWVCGHLHSSKVSHSMPVDGQAGVTVRTLRSLSGRDAWHNAKGYVANDQAAEAYLYSRATGYVGHFVARPRELMSA